ncbi:hypothetical protein HDC30_002450 [Pseudomonas sp. JAI115]|nr:hypothetical protein [Pseudomonas sp. JAI115]
MGLVIEEGGDLTHRFRSVWGETESVMGKVPNSYAEQLKQRRDVMRGVEVFIR